MTIVMSLQGQQINGRLHKVQNTLSYIILHVLNYNLYESVHVSCNLAFVLNITFLPWDQNDNIEKIIIIHTVYILSE